MAVQSHFWKDSPRNFQKSFAIDPVSAATKITFPSVLEPRDSTSDLSNLIEGARELAPGLNDTVDNNPIRKLLDQHGGAVYLKNLPLRSAEDFSRFLDALSGQGKLAWHPHEPVAMNVLRKELAKNVLTVNEGPPSQVISWHSEFSISPSHPSYVVFFCLKPPVEGGTTGISQSQAVYNRLKTECPRFLRRCLFNGISYPAPHYVTQSSMQFFGNGLYSKSAYGPTDGTDISTLAEEQTRQIVEDRICALATSGGWSKTQCIRADLPVWQQKGFSWEWREDGIDVVHRVPGLRVHPTTKTTTLFTALGSRYIQAKERNTFTPPHSYINGDGQKARYLPPMYAAHPEDQPIPEHELDVLQDLQDQLSVDIEWEIGDVLIIDNFAVQHSRMPWTGERKILASFWDQEDLVAVPKPLWDF